MAGRVPETVVVYRCPPAKDYDLKELGKLADELEVLRKANPKSRVIGLVSDMRAMRDECRALEEMPQPVLPAPADSLPGRN